MRYVLAVLLLLVIFLIAVLFCQTMVRISYCGGVLQIRVRLLFFCYTFDSGRVAKSKKKKEKEQAAEPEDSDESRKEENRSIGDWIDRLKGYYTMFCDISSAAYRVLRALRHKIQIKGVAVRARYGTGDAASTGIAYGGAWAAVSQLYVLFGRYFVFDFPQLELTPVFDRKCFDMAAEGIIRFRLAHIMKAVVIGICYYFRRASRSKKDADR